jgi:hypothetical protein
VNFYGSRVEQFAGFARTKIVREGGPDVVKFLLFLLLLVFCWPLALIGLILYPIVWLLLLPFRIVGIAVGGALELVWALVTLPARLLRGLA